MRRLLRQQGFSRNNVQRGKELGLKVTRLAWDSRVQEERVAKNHFQSWGDNSPFFPLVNGENRLWFLGLGMASTREQVFKKKKKKSLCMENQRNRERRSIICVSTNKLSVIIPTVCECALSVADDSLIPPAVYMLEMFKR